MGEEGDCGGCGCGWERERRKEGEKEGGLYRGAVRSHVRVRLGVVAAVGWVGAARNCDSLWFVVVAVVVAVMVIVVIVVIVVVVMVVVAVVVVVGGN